MEKVYTTPPTGKIVIHDCNEAIKTVLHFCDRCQKDYLGKKKCSGRNPVCEAVRKEMLHDFSETG